MLRRHAWLGLLLTALPAGMVFASQRAADSLGESIGRDAALALSRIPLFPRPAPAAVDPTPAPEFRAEAAPPVSVAEPVRGKRRRGKTTQSAADQSVFVSASTVLALASRGVAPRGVAVPASGSRPAGLRMVGVGALGVGLRDGDVLTRVSGAPATSFGAVVDAVIRARAQNARIISGEFWRDGRAHALAVEQPYVAPASTLASAPRAP